MAKTLFDHLNAITRDQDPKYWDNISEEDKKTWSNYMVHRFLSMNYDFVDLIAELQPLTQTMEPKMFYLLMIGVIPKGKYYLRYIKGKGEEIANEKLVELLQIEYTCSKNTAIDYYNILTAIKEGPEYFEYLKSKYGEVEKEKGKKSSKPKTKKK
jgi:hypothetical protein